MNINNKIKEQTLSWIMKEKEGLNKEEIKELQVFLNNINHKKMYEKYNKIFSGCKSFEKDEKDEIKDSIQKDKKVFKFITTFIPLAASILIVFFASSMYFDYTSSTYTNTLQTNNNKKVNIHLPDNSYIDMDIKSKMSVTYYKNKRLINFETGKAVFSVSKDKNRPFIITSNNTRIEVIGTKFEVISLDNINTINVVEGLVKISHIYNQKIKNLIILKKGESFSLNNLGKEIKLTNINIDRIAQWKDDLITFKKTSLYNALKEFARYNNIKIEFKDNKSSLFEISGVFSIKDLDKFILSLPEIYPLIIKKEKDLIIVEGLK